MFRVVFDIFCVNTNLRKPQRPNNTHQLKKDKTHAQKLPLLIVVTNCSQHVSYFYNVSAVISFKLRSCAIVGRVKSQKREIRQLKREMKNLMAGLDVAVEQACQIQRDLNDVRCPIF